MRPDILGAMLEFLISHGILQALVRMAAFLGPIVNVTGCEP